MRKLFVPAVGIALLLQLLSCSEDFKVAAPYKQVTVAYGIMNIKDTAQYFRIQKAFLDDAQSALVMAQTADSNFYDSLHVSMLELNGNNTVVSAIPLSRVNLDEEGYPKESGTFFTSPNYAYKYKHNLNTAYSYRLLIVNTVTGQRDSAQIAMIDTSIFRVPIFNSVAYKVSFHYPNPNGLWQLTVSAGTHAPYYEGDIRFNYVDSSMSTGTAAHKYVDWSFNTVMSINKPSFNLEARNYSFYSFLNAAIGPAPAGITRFMDSCELTIWAGSEELQQYTRISQVSGGLTGDQIKPTYTNLQSTNKGNVLGVIASRTYIKRTAPIDPVSVDSLKINAPSLNVGGVYLH
jgi:hypothetical protein